MGVMSLRIEILTNERWRWEDMTSITSGELMKTEGLQLFHYIELHLWVISYKAKYSDSMILEVKMLI